MGDRGRALNVAEVQLAWMVDRDRYRKALSVLADTDTRATIAAGSRDDTGRRSIGSHSDPTALAATGRLDSTTGDRKTARRITRDAKIIAETAQWIRAVTSGGDYAQPYTLAGALDDVRWCSTAPHATAAWAGSAEESRELDHACDLLAEEASHLAAVVASVLRSAVRPPTGPPPSKPLAGCKSCARAKDSRGKAAFTPTAEGRYRDLCRTCGEFNAAHGHWPPVAVAQWILDHGKMPSGAFVDAALRTDPQRKRRRRKG